MNTAERAVGDLAITLGILVGASIVTSEQIDCYIESVLVLAFQARVSRQDALQPFDIFRDKAEKVWDELDRNWRARLSDLFD